MQTQIVQFLNAKTATETHGMKSEMQHDSRRQKKATDFDLAFACMITTILCLVSFLVLLAPLRSTAFLTAFLIG